MPEKRHFDLGEKKYIDWIIRKNRADDTLVITGAQWELVKEGKTVEASGACTISGNMISALIEPKEKGWYILRATITVPPEIHIAEVEIDVD